MPCKHLTKIDELVQHTGGNLAIVRGRSFIAGYCGTAILIFPALIKIFLAFARLMH